MRHSLALGCLLALAAPARAAVELPAVDVQRGPALAGDHVAWIEHRYEKTRLVVADAAGTRAVTALGNEGFEVAASPGWVAALVSEPFGLEAQWLVHAGPAGGAASVLASCPQTPEQEGVAIALSDQRLAITGTPCDADPAKPAVVIRDLSGGAQPITVPQPADRFVSRLELAGPFVATLRSAKDPGDDRSELVVQEVATGAERIRLAGGEAFPPAQFALADDGTVAVCDNHHVKVATPAAPTLRAVPDGRCDGDVELAGGRLLFAAGKLEAFELWAMNLDGTGKQLVGAGNDQTLPGVASWDGTRAAMAVAECRADAVAIATAEDPYHSVHCPLKLAKAAKLVGRTLRFHATCPSGCRGEVYVHVGKDYLPTLKPRKLKPGTMTMTVPKKQLARVRRAKSLRLVVFAVDSVEPEHTYRLKITGR